MNTPSQSFEYPWPEVPDWVQWIATDARDNEVTFFAEKPPRKPWWVRIEKRPDSLRARPVGGVEDERAAFEAWAELHNAYSLQTLRRPDGEYWTQFTALAWRAWQARAALATTGEQACSAGEVELIGYVYRGESAGGLDYQLYSSLERARRHRPPGDGHAFAVYAAHPDPGSVAEDAVERAAKPKRGIRIVDIATLLEWHEARAAAHTKTYASPHTSRTKRTNALRHAEQHQRAASAIRSVLGVSNVVQ